MPAYIVLTREHTHDAKEMEQYASKAKAAREGHDPQPLAFYGDFEVLEGSAMEGAVILRFPDMAAARAWYESPAYQDARKHRFQGADYRVFLVDGIEEA
ncbi:DUF1330 domain-containing protein [Vreelandella venusta]|uniref:DUF1330 domain-containing protein n=1 Tax=Vreelandella venusta TaxID=44935 RepID=A0AAP9ZE62_9GAMM|nr:DUF1330 domain-containing protein [Halomonas venusta]QPI64896.1 DUF1330 domain-containing protein [Halomonas venusta]QRL04086.1 DUF1330 domain-containing protein [Halomonas venusta]WAM56334.1 DUF1330 domain-containing protein [Halomonas venusta]GEK51832.1 hypothetical protein HVE01_25530 [Halomonas venusta]